MRHFNFELQTESQEIIYKIISGLLPHKNYEKELAKSLQLQLFQTVRKEETYGAVYVFYHMFDNIHRIFMTNKNFAVILSRDVFEASLTTSIADLIMRPEFNQAKFFSEYGKEINTASMAQLQDATDFAYTALMQKYDELFKMELSTSEAMGYIPTLKTQLQGDAIRQSLIVYGTVLNKGYSSGKELYVGPQGYMKIQRIINAEVDERFSISNTRLSSLFMATTINSVQEAKEFHERANYSYETLSTFGFEPYDNKFGLATHDIATIIAGEGVGKTRYLCDVVFRAMQAKNNVLVIPTETGTEKFRILLLCRALFEFYKVQLSFSEFNNPMLIPCKSESERERIIIQMHDTEDRLFGSGEFGKLTLLQNIYYETFMTRMLDFYSAEDISMVFTDHVGALISDGSYTSDGRLVADHARIDFLYRAQSILTEITPLCFVNFSHTSVKGAESDESGDEPTVREGALSSSVSKFSSILLRLRKPAGIKGDYVKLYLTKCRDQPCDIPPVILTRLGYSNKHVYDPKIQRITSKEENTSFAELIG